MMKKTFFNFLLSKGNMAGMTCSAIILLVNDLLILLPTTNAFWFWEIMVIIGYSGCYWYYQYEKPRQMLAKGIAVHEGFWMDLEWLMKRYGKKLPPSAQQRLQRIHSLCQELADIYPSLTAEHQYTIKHMITDYIPTTLNHYLRLPHSVRNQKTPVAQKLAAQLETQLQLLEESLHDIVSQAGEVGLHNLKINTRFLQQRFGIQPAREEQT